jgi:hypothetical protein
MSRLAAVTIFLLAACGGGGGNADGGPGDGGGIDGSVDAGSLIVENCPETYGPGLIAATFQVAGAGVGFDLDGDTGGDAAVDNAIGEINGLRSLVNGSLQDSLDAGTLRLLADLRMFSGLGGDDPDVTVAAYGGVDSDDPAATGDDFNGDEDYYYTHDSVNLDSCVPKALLSGSYEGGVLSVGPQTIGFFIDSLGGFLTIARTSYQGTIEADTEGLRTPAGSAGLLGGAITACSLSRATPDVFAYSLLHDLHRLFMLDPDIDLDGDGLETIQTVDNQTDIVSCTDGNGTTVIEGSDCPCDPRIADGYSIAFTLDFRGATVLGPDPTP